MHLSASAYDSHLHFFHISDNVCDVLGISRDVDALCRCLYVVSIWGRGYQHPHPGHRVRRPHRKVIGGGQSDHLRDDEQEIPTTFVEFAQFIQQKFVHEFQVRHWKQLEFHYKFQINTNKFRFRFNRK